MTAPAITVAADAPLAVVARLMGSRGIKRLPVVEADRLVGIVTRADRLRAMYRHPEPAPSASDGEIRNAIRSILEKEDWAAGAIVEDLFERFRPQK